MSIHDSQRKQALSGLLDAYTDRPLPGISTIQAKNVFLEQIVESEHRTRFVQAVQQRPISDLRMDPSSELFDPVRAAILQRNEGNFDEAFWLIFLFVHFGKNKKSAYRLVRDVYGRLGTGTRWDWEATSQDTFGFRMWLDKNQKELKDKTVHRAFGNHRKYQSLDAWKVAGTGAVIESYVQWVHPPRTHQELFASIAEGPKTKGEAFQRAYKEMSKVVSFGRTARFDYLTMVGKLALADIKPDSTYMHAATGPADGARLLFCGAHNARVSAKTLEMWSVHLGNHLGLDMQVVEDSFCNWQKSPDVMIRFRG